MGVSTYKNNYLPHQKLLIAALGELTAQISIEIDEHKKSLYRENSA